MNTTLQSLIGILALCVLVAACGKDKKAAEAAPAIANNPVVTAPVNTASNFVTATSWDDFKSKVASGNFTPPTVSNLDYIYQTCTTSNDKFLGFINFTSNSCSSSFTRSMMAGQLIREDGLNSKQAVITYLNGLIAQVPNAMYYRQLGPSAFQFQAGNTIYVVNLAYPAEANPTFKYSSSGGTGYQLTNFIFRSN